MGDRRLSGFISDSEIATYQAQICWNFNYFGADMNLMKQRAQEKFVQPNFVANIYT